MGLTSYHFYTDGGGNITEVANSAGALVASYAYDAYGNVQESGGTPGVTRLGYQGKERIANIVDFGYRFYRPDLGRWLTRDPIRESGGLNLYGYVGNNPVNNFDEYGLWGIAWDSPWGSRYGATDPTFLFGRKPNDGPSPLFRGTQPGDDEFALIETRGRAVDTAITASSSMAETGMRGYGEAANQLMGSCAIKGLGIVAGGLRGVGAAAGSGVRIIDREGDLVIGAFSVANGEARFTGTLIREGDDLIVRGAHIEGDATMKEVLRVANQYGRENGVKRVIIEGGKRTTGINPGHFPRPIIVNIR